MYSVRLYRRDKGVVDAVILPGRRMGLSPILLQGLSKANLRETLRPELAKMPASVAAASPGESPG